MTGSFGTVLRAVVAGALLAILFYMVDFRVFVAAISGTSAELLAVVFLLTLFGTVVIKVWIALRVTGVAGLSLGFWDLLNIHLISRFYTVVLPRGASAIIRWNLYRAGGSGHGAAALFLFESLISIFTVFLSATLLLSTERERVGDIWWVLFSLGAAGSMAMSVALLAFFSASVRRRVVALWDGAASWLTWRPLREHLERFHDAVAAFERLPIRDVMAIVGMSFVGFVLFILSAVFLAYGMGMTIGWIAIAWVRSVSLIVSLVPVTVAGLGVREVTYVGLLGLYGVGGAEALAFSLTLFAIQVVIALLGAVLEIRRWVQRSP